MIYVYTSTNLHFKFSCWLTYTMNISYVINYTSESFRRLHSAVPRRLQSYQPSIALLFYNTANLKDEESKLAHPEQKLAPTEIENCLYKTNLTS